MTAPTIDIDEARLFFRSFANEIDVFVAFVVIGSGG